MADNDFFSDPNTQIKDEAKTEEVAKIKVGDEEYTQDDLQKLVGLGKIGRESEEKFKTPIDKVWPTTQKVINENAELRKQLEDRKNADLQSKINQGGQLSNEELRDQARKQARELGLIDDQTFDQRFTEAFAKNTAVQALLGDTSVAIEKYKNDYGINTKVDDVLRYMDDNGLKNPDKAIKLMFEEKIDQVKEQKIKSIKPQGMKTNDASQAGGKEPGEVKITKDNLDAQLHEFLQNAS